MKNNFTKRNVSKIWTGTTRTLLGAGLLLGLNGLARADTGNCSDRTVKGDYAFTISGETLNPTGTKSAIQGVALTTFDGFGKLKQMDFVVTDGTPGPANGNALEGFRFQGGETGKYVINANCTGSAEIDLNVPLPYGSKGVIKLILVISDKGNTIHTVVAEITPPGAIAPALNTTRAEGYRIKTENRDHN
jgi:hypothetical protein